MTEEKDRIVMETIRPEELPDGFTNTFNAEAIADIYTGVQCNMLTYFDLMGNLIYGPREIAAIDFGDTRTYALKDGLTAVVETGSYSHGGVIVPKVRVTLGSHRKSASLDDVAGLICSKGNAFVRVIEPESGGKIK